MASTATDSAQSSLTRELQDIEQQIAALKLKAADARRRLEPTPVSDYTLAYAGSGVRVKLSELFGDRQDLIVIHNMGRKCAYCTLWADGFAGVYKHLSSRCAFVLATPDEPVVAAAFAAARHWTFPIVSISASPFGREMGFQRENGGVLPGASAFSKGPDAKIVRTSTAAEFGPGDNFCPVWHLLDLLKDGANGWEPKYHY
jgi:predicted dithiol-disulfide oxidoreductase (DUF899 family)